MQKIHIENSDDYFEITKNVKWEVPNKGNNTTVNFAFIIPYVFYIEDKSYTGTYTLGDFSDKKDENLKYNLEILNLTSEGKIKITKY